MTIDFTDLTQLGIVTGFVVALFVLYRVLVKAKDAEIGNHKSKIELLDKRIEQLESHAPDALIPVLNQRISTYDRELGRLTETDVIQRQELDQKKEELEDLRSSLQSLNRALEKEALLCPHCNAPVSRRDSFTVSGYVGDREVEADVEYREYSCGYALREDQQEPVSGCSRGL